MTVTIRARRSKGCAAVGVGNKRRGLVKLVPGPPVCLGCWPSNMTGTGPPNTSTPPSRAPSRLSRRRQEQSLKKSRPFSSLTLIASQPDGRQNEASLTFLKQAGTGDASWFRARQLQDRKSDLPVRPGIGGPTYWKRWVWVWPRPRTAVRAGWTWLVVDGHTDGCKHVTGGLDGWVSNPDTLWADRLSFGSPSLRTAKVTERDCPGQGGSPAAEREFGGRPSALLAVTYARSPGAS